MISDMYTDNFWWKILSTILPYPEDLKSLGFILYDIFILSLHVKLISKYQYLWY